MATVGFIGVGNMGTAIIRGLARRKDVKLLGLDLDAARLKALGKECGLKSAASVKELVRASDYVVLAVKPQQAPEVLQEAGPALGRTRCLVSIAAGLTVARLKELSGAKCPVARVMPNTPALVGEGVFALCLDDPGLKKAQREFLSGLFTSLGQVHVLAEKLFDAFTAVIGSGPAYVFYFMQALADAAVNLGLPRAQAVQMVQGLFAGSAKLAGEDGRHLGELTDMVCSPAGTTIRGVLHMDRTGVKGNIADAARESYLRSVELGKK